MKIEFKCKSIFQALFIHSANVLDSIGNWVFNIYLFNQLNSIDEKAAYIAIFFTAIRLSNFASLFLGGKFLQKPKPFFYLSISLRVLVLILLYSYVIQENSAYQIPAVLSTLFFKNFIGGIDTSIYNQAINLNLNHPKLHYKIKEFTFPISLLLSYPIYEYLVQLEPNTPILFDIISFGFLLTVIWNLKFEDQIIEKKFFLSRKDIFKHYNVIEGMDKILVNLTLSASLHTLVFNNTYEQYLNISGNISELYAVIGWSFFTGTALAKLLKYKISLYFIAVLLTSIQAAHNIVLLNENNLIILFALSNIIYAYNLYFMNTEFFSQIPPKSSIVLTSLYSLHYLLASIFGAWFLLFVRIDSFVLSLVGAALFCIFLWIIRFLINSGQQSNSVHSLGLDLYFFPFTFNYKKYIHFHCNSQNTNVSQILRFTPSSILKVKLMKDKIYSEIVERHLSKEKLAGRKYIPLSNGCSAHCSKSMSQVTSLNEILERDSIITHFQFNIPPIHTEEEIFSKSNTRNTYSFWTTNSPEVISCMLTQTCNNKFSGIGYCSIHLQDFRNLHENKPHLKAFEEFLVTKSSHDNAKIKTPSFNRREDTFITYFERNIGQYSPSSLILNGLLEMPELFNYLKIKDRLINYRTFNKEIWKTIHPFSNVKTTFCTEYIYNYSRYFTYPSSFDHLYPTWPNLTQKDLIKIKNRIKPSFRNKYNSVDKGICPII